MTDTAVALWTCGLLLLWVTCTTALPTGAPTAACSDLTPQHFGTTPSPCGPNCPFSLALTAVDGSPPGNAMQYRCGSLHTIRVQTSDPTMTFRGIVMQARQSTPTFSNDASFVGSFTMPPAEGDWRIWDCAADSATHTNRNDKTAIDLTWQAPGGPSTANVTLWFSIVRVFTMYHIQLRGLDLAPEPASCAPATPSPPITSPPTTPPLATPSPPTPPEPLVLNFINNSPRVQGNDITVEVQTSRPVLTFLCALTGRPYQDCSSGSTTFSNVPPRVNDRPYILRVAANTSDGVRTVLRRVVRIEQANICTVHLINDGVTISGNTATVEFASTGPSATFLCSLDRQDPVSCSSGQQFSGLSAGGHTLKIVADNCGTNRRPLVVEFTVEGVSIG